MDTSEESAITGECRNGNLTRFTVLYDAYAEKIYRFIYYKTHHKETAEDLLSIVFTKALENIARFDKSKAAFSTWLYQIARNSVIDHYRTTKQTADIEDVWDLADDTDIVRDVDIAMKSENIKAYMKELKPHQRDIIMMRLWQGLSYEEIAAANASSQDAVKMAFSRAIKALREKMPASAFALLVFFGI